MPERPTRRALTGYFLRLGALGFGGPVALANAMRRDLVDVRGWIDAEEYERGLAIAAACPGPLAYQLGVYCGYVRFGVAGGLAVAVAFALPPFVLVVATAVLYLRFGASHALRALFYGIAPVVVALIVKACWSLGRKTLRGGVRAWLFFLFSFGLTLAVQRELTALFLGAGALGAFLFAEPQGGTLQTASRPPTRGTRLRSIAAFLPLAWLRFPALTIPLFLFFFRTGLMVFGSGLVIVPFLKTYVVDEYHWLGNREFLDAVAIGMISPGPVVISATFVGYLLAGLPGALAASLGIFGPSVLFTLGATPVLLRSLGNRRVLGFLRGITLAVVGVLAGTTGLVARTSIVDALTLAIGVTSFIGLVALPRVPEPVWIAAGGLAGLLALPSAAPPI